MPSVFCSIESDRPCHCWFAFQMMSLLALLPSCPRPTPAPESYSKQNTSEIPHKHSSPVAPIALWVTHPDTQKLFEKLLIHKFPRVWWTGWGPVETANTLWGGSKWCKHKHTPSSRSREKTQHICVCTLEYVQVVCCWLCFKTAE